MSKALKEEKALLLEELQTLLDSAETRAFEDGEVVRVEEIRARVGEIETTLATKEKNINLERGTKTMKNIEIREILANGQEVEVRNGEITNANVGVEKVEFLGGVIEKVSEISPLFAKARKINTASTTALTIQGAKLPKFVKMNELQAYTKSQATFEEKVLKADKYGLCVEVSDECLEDAYFDLEGQISAQMTEGMALTCNELAVAKLESAEGAKSVSVALDADGLMDMYYAIKPAYRNGAVWVINPEMEVAIAKLKDATGQPLMIRAYTDRPVYTILGCEVIVDENVTKPMFVNLDKALVVGLRRAFNIKRDDSIGFLSGSVAFRADIRLDMVTTVEEAIAIGVVAQAVRAKK